MKFSVLVFIAPSDLEDTIRDIAADAGVGGVTVIAGRGTGMDEKKSFFGLTVEGQQAILLYVLEKRLALRVMKSVSKHPEVCGNALAFTMPIDHISGISYKEIEKFEESIREEI